MTTQAVIDHYGSVKAAAVALGISDQAIYQWGEMVPPVRAYQIEVLTAGLLRAQPPAATDGAA